MVSNPILSTLLGLRHISAAPTVTLIFFRDLRALVVGLESGLIPKFQCGILELTATCFGRCPLRKIHTGVSNLDVARLADDDLFGDWGLRLIAALRPGYVLYEMTPPHSASYKSHSYVTQELVKMEYLVSAYDRFPCDLTGARTSRFRWINVGVRQSDGDAVLPPVDCTAGQTAGKDKHMQVRFFKHRGNVKSGQLRIKFIGTKENVSDFFTKALLRAEFYKFRALCMNEVEMAEVEM